MGRGVAVVSCGKLPERGRNEGRGAISSPSVHERHEVGGNGGGGRAVAVCLGLQGVCQEEGREGVDVSYMGLSRIDIGEGRG